MHSRRENVIALTAVVALVMAIPAILPANASDATATRASDPPPANATPLDLDRVTRRGDMVEIRGRTDPRAEVTVNGQPVPMVSRNGSFSYFLRVTAHDAKITVTAHASGSPPRTLIVKPAGSR